jgi:hypothetical protein
MSVSGNGDDDVMVEAKPENVCPGCRSGDHFKCDRGAWDFETDGPTVCYCYANEHQVTR